MKRQFCEAWRFSRNGGEWQQVTLPHDAMLGAERAADAPGGSAAAFFRGGRYVYERTFELAAQEIEKHITFEFEAVYKNAEIFLNGERAGGGAYGFTPIFIAADGLLREGENVLRVECENADQPDSRWYSGAGMLRPVWMYVQEDIRLKIGGIRIRTESVNSPRVSLEVKHSGGEVRVRILDGEAEAAFRCEAVSGEVFDVTLPGAELWSAEHPKLYTAEVTLLDGERAVETERIPFGIREVTWGPKGLFVNGAETFLRGGCIHSDNGILGAAEPHESAERRIRILKKGGFNAIRSAHNPCSAAILEACDRLGMYVMDETWDMWYRKKSPYDYAGQFERNYRWDLEALVAKDFNHPSVLLYSIGNEVSEPAEERGVKLAEEMRDLLHELDPSRAVTGGFNLMIIANAARGRQLYKDGGGKDESGDEKMNDMNSTMFNLIASMVGSGMNMAANGKKADLAVTPVLDTVDIAGYNYASGRYTRDPKLHPDRVIVGSETFPQDLAKNWALVKKYPQLVGDFMWTAWDYLGETGIGAWSFEEDAKGFAKPYPWLLGDAGAYDILGNPTGEALWAKAVWDESGKPYLAVRPLNHPHRKLVKAVWRGTNAIPSWSWDGCEGNAATAEVYSSAPYVELYLNRRKIGRKRTKNCRAIFRLKYRAGELLARSLDKSGKEIARTRLVTGGGAQILARPEKKTARPGELVYVDVRIADANGIVESNRDTELRVTVENGELAGFGSANPRTEERYGSGEFTTWYGRALAVLRVGERGPARIRVEGAPFPEAVAEIEVK